MDFWTKELLKNVQDRYNRDIEESPVLSEARKMIGLASSPNAPLSEMDIDELIQLTRECSREISKILVDTYKAFLVPKPFPHECMDIDMTREIIKPTFKKALDDIEEYAIQILHSSGNANVTSEPVHPEFDYEEFNRDVEAVLEELRFFQGTEIDYAMAMEIFQGKYPSLPTDPQKLK